MSQRPATTSDPPRVAYVSEMDKLYVKAIKACPNLAVLKAVLNQYKPFAWDGWVQVQNLTWKDYKKGVRCIQMPAVIFFASYIAIDAKCPWGLAFNRLLDIGQIIWKEDHYEVAKQASNNE